MDIAIPPREETGSQISARLLEVIAHAELEVLPGLYAFGPLTEDVTPRKEALACVRDGGAWSQLVPVDDGAPPMAFRVFSFHFDPAAAARGGERRRRRRPEWRAERPRPLRVLPAPAHAEPARSRPHGAGRDLLARQARRDRPRARPVQCPAEQRRTRGPDGVSRARP